MPKKRRKLNKDFEKKIISSGNTIELINAKINDIDEKDIQEEYREAFNKVVYAYARVEQYYKDYGYDEEIVKHLASYYDLLKHFEESYEI